MRFSPTPETERGQLQIFSGEETLSAEFDSAFVRVHPSDFEDRVSTDRLMPVAVDPRELRRAEDTFAREAPKSFSIDLSDVSSNTWWLLPQRGDFLAEVRTRRFRTLTYSRIGAQIEDITVFERERRRTISLYPSAERFKTLGRAYNEADLRDYDVLEYALDIRVDPEREFIEGRARVRLRVLAGALSTLTLRLSDDLNVTAVASVELGMRLLHLRVAGQNSLIVNLPEPITRDQEASLIVVYSGRVASQAVDTEAVAVAPQDDFPAILLQRSFLLSNRAFWYPQNPIGDYATATMRVTVPADMVAIGSGARQEAAAVRLQDLITQPAGTRSFSFEATRPLRYLALVVSRFNRVAESNITTTNGDRVAVTVEAQPRQQGRGRELLPVVEDMVRFYAELTGEAPYEATTLALVESELPGGHSPGYVAIVNTPLPGQPYTWGNDPAAFEDFPDFFLAHEVAHQWWGQAVGWRNYHEQWISEGFAQYFAALYGRRTRGEQTFAAMLRQFRRWAIAESDEGPISLGQRLGHVKQDTRIFRALVYNKAAGVLHMLSRLIGDEAFLAGVQRFYSEQKFQRTGTEDARRAFEATAGRPLERFFEGWIYGSEIPRIRVTRVVSPASVTVGFEQLGETVFDLPVTVTLVYSDGRSEDVVVAVGDRKIDQRIPVRSAVRQVQINRDNAALAEFQLTW
jgi:aminopeptidase N